jgi:ribose/xylose/arabinose/galactoside ABC-type transport system permease subunit
MSLPNKTINKPHFFTSRLSDERKESLIRLANDQLIWFILIIFFVIISLIAPRFTSQLNITNILLHSAALGIMVVAQVHCLLLGKVDLSIESTLGFTAMFGAILMWDFNLSAYIAIPLMLAMGALIGFINSIMILKFKINEFIVTLGMLIVLRGLSLVISEGTTRYGFPKVFLAFAAHTKDGLISIPVIIMLVTYIIFHIILSKRVRGRQMYAVGGNTEAAFASGINTSKVITRSYIISGTLAALSGIILAARLDSVPTSLGEGMVFEVMAASVVGGVSMLGGRGNLIGALGGVLLLSSIDSALVLTRVPTFWVQTAKGMILLFAVFLDAFKLRIVPVIRRKWLRGSEMHSIVGDESNSSIKL